MAEKSPQFQHWLHNFKCELNALLFVRSFREGNFSLYCETLSKVLTWMSALDHVNYSSWLSVYVRDMYTLNEVCHEFLAGNFVIRKTNHNFGNRQRTWTKQQSRSKADGGAIGLTKSPVVLRRWMVAGRKMARLAKGFETLVRPQSNTTVSYHEDKK